MRLCLTILCAKKFHAGHSGRVGEVSYQILHPRAGKRAESDNASSLCLLLEFAGKRVLLPGDLEGSGLLDLTELPPRPLSCHDGPTPWQSDSRSG
ncbi:MAG: hypothetical protein R3C56_04205 [Pirellulaceae bacterium]